MAIASVDERLKKYKDMYQPQMQEQINAVNQAAAQQKDTVQNTYNSEIAKTKQSYDDEIQRNLVQKYVNEQQIAENMSNLGLTDSGLNRTQQTAAQLSYSNNRSKIDRQLQSAVDAFVQNMNSKLSDIETSRIGSEASIKQSYDNAALSAAQNEYKTEYDNEAAKYKANVDAQAAAAKAYYSSSGSSSKSSSSRSSGSSGSGSDESGVTTYRFGYTDGLNSVFYDSKGKKYTFSSGVNPYTGTNNNILYKGQKFFSNGYQPSQIVLNGAWYNLKKSGVTDVVNGVSENVWQTGGGREPVRYWIWDGTQNKYLSYQR